MNMKDLRKEEEKDIYSFYGILIIFLGVVLITLGYGWKGIIGGLSLIHLGFYGTWFIHKRIDKKYENENKN